jgi:trehalose 6-phosphate synthase
VRRKLIVVSNRGPVTFSRDSDGRRVAGRGGGGLAGALRGLTEENDVVWIASAMSDEDREVAREGASVCEGYELRLIAHDAGVYEQYYGEISNGALWFLQHYLWGLASEPDLGPAFHAAWQGYVAANRAFADAVAGELERMPEADVSFHDYHLYLAPRFVRERCPRASLSHFLHIPWVQPDYWRVLPTAVGRAIHEGLAANDTVGFHSERWRRSFLESCEAFGVESPATFVAPIGIDADEFDVLAESEAVAAEEAHIVARRPELLVVRVDRTDPSKNIVRGFRAFALLLERHPELAGRVGMLALLDPSRQHVSVYAEYRAAVEREARVVNERFGRPGWEPVDLEVADNFPQAVAAYKQYDVLLVNAVYDGMNLVAKEGPIANRRDGVLVLSENAGAFDELGEWALGVNPFDLEEQAEALHEALTMPAAERRRRAEAIAGWVRGHGIDEWTATLLAELDRHTSTITSP